MRDIEKTHDDLLIIPYQAQHCTGGRITFMNKNSYMEAVEYLYSLQKYGVKFGLSKTSNRSRRSAIRIGDGRMSTSGEPTAKGL